MDYSPILAQVWRMMRTLIPAVLLIDLLKSTWVNRQIGELPDRLLAHWALDKKTCGRLHSVPLKTPDGMHQSTISSSCPMASL